MRAVIAEKPGGPEVLRVEEMPDPLPGPDQVRVRVRAAGLNRADLLQRRGQYPAPADADPRVLGLEFAGEVERVGALVKTFKEGDRVMGLCGGGAHADRVVVHERLLMRTPPNLDHVQAASVPEAYITAHDALFTQGTLAPGERLLVHAVGSGVGLAAVQLAHAAGCWVVGTSRTATKLERAREQGLDAGVLVENTHFASKVREATGGAGVHLVADFMGASYLHDNLASRAYQGRLVIIGLMGGMRAEIDLSQLMTRRLKVWGTVLRSRPLEEKAAATHLFAEHALPWLARGMIKPIIDRVYPVQAIQAAHQQMERNENFGKIVLTF
jgi:putative PIG3 family NAD(P)H quinone oxidoreductase